MFFQNMKYDLILRHGSTIFDGPINITLFCTSDDGVNERVVVIFTYIFWNFDGVINDTTHQIKLTVKFLNMFWFEFESPVFQSLQQPEADWPSFSSPSLHEAKPADTHSNDGQLSNYSGTFTGWAKC